MSHGDPKHGPLREMVLAHLWRRRFVTAVALLCLGGTVLTELAAPWPLKIIFDRVLLGRPLHGGLSLLDGLFRLGTLPAVAVLSASVFLLVALGGALSYVQVYLATRSGYELAAELRQRLFAHIQRLPLAFHSRARTGELLMKASTDTTAIRDAIGDWGIRAAYQFLMIGAMVLVMALVNWRLSLVVVGSLPVLYLVLTRLNRRIRTSVSRQRRQEGRIAARMGEVLGAIAMVQAFARHDHEDRRFAAENAANLAEGINTARSTAAVTRVIELVCALSTALTIFAGTWQAYRGYMSPGDLLIFVSYLRTLYKPIRDLGRVSVKMTRARVCAERIDQVLALQPVAGDRDGARAVANLAGDIRFEQVSFSYDPRHPVLDGASFHIEAGQRVALVGPSGIGKSSVIALLLRLYEPQSGRILIDGIALNGYQRDALRRQIGVVLQDTTLFEGSIRDNICYGLPEADDSQVEAAARAAHAHEFITAFPDGYATQVGERGSTLSGGQRQRVCLARALIKRPSVLILDEPTSAVDPASAQLIRAALEQCHAGRTVLVICHEVPATQEYDQVLTLQAGRVSSHVPGPRPLRLRGAG